MTLHDLVRKKEEIDRAIEDMDQAFKPVGTALTELEKAIPKNQQLLLEPLRAAVFNASKRDAVGKELLYAYSRMISEIMERTEIAWPPKCIQASDG